MIDRPAAPEARNAFRDGVFKRERSGGPGKLQIEFYDIDDRETLIFSIDAVDCNIPRTGDKVLIFDDANNASYDVCYVAEVLWVFGSFRPGGFYWGKRSSVDIILREPVEGEST